MKQRNWIIIVIVLIILNLFTMGALWFTHIRNQQLGVNLPKQEKFLREKLNLDKEQMRKMKESRQRHFAQVEPIDKEINELKHELFTSSGLTQDQVGSLLSEIGSKQRNLDSLMLVHFIELRSFCTEEQLSGMNQLINDITSQRFGPGKGRIPRHPKHGFPPQ